MKLTVNEIAALVKGRVVGDGARVIKGVAGLEEASASDISYLRDATKPAALQKFKSTSAGAVIVPAGIQDNGRTLVEVKNTQAAFALLLGVIEKENFKKPAGIHPQAVVSPKAKIGSNCEIGPLSIVEDDAVIGDNTRIMGQVYIGVGAKIGRDTFIYPQVMVRENITIGDRCIIHSGTVIGSDGFGYYFADGKHNKIPQIGSVLIEDDVELGAGCTIDRATIGVTAIRKGVKLDNMVHIAHNVEIGSLSIIAAQTGIAGSTTIGKGVMMGGQVGISDHVNVGDGAQLGAKTGVMQDVEPKSILFGVPAQPLKAALKQFVLLKKLGKIYKDLKGDE